MQQTRVRTNQQSLWDKFWKGEEGHYVIWQMPNAWLIGWAVLTFVSLLFSGKVSDVFSWAGSGALIVWSLLEIFKGDSYFRRVLGAVVLVFAVMSLMRNL